MEADIVRKSELVRRIDFEAPRVLFSLGDPRELVDQIVEISNIVFTNDYRTLHIKLNWEVIPPSDEVHSTTRGFNPLGVEIEAVVLDFLTSLQHVWVSPFDHLPLVEQALELIIEELKHEQEFIRAARELPLPEDLRIKPVWIDNHSLYFFRGKPAGFALRLGRCWKKRTGELLVEMICLLPTTQAFLVYVSADRSAMSDLPQQLGTEASSAALELLQELCDRLE